MRQNRWHSENQFKPTPRLLTRENHEIQQPIGKYEWMFAIAAIFISIVIGAIIIRFVFNNLSSKFHIIVRLTLCLYYQETSILLSKSIARTWLLDEFLYFTNTSLMRKITENNQK